MTSWSRGVIASTLDPESSDRGSNPRETCCVAHVVVHASRPRCPHRSSAPLSGGPHPSGPPFFDVTLLRQLSSCPRGGMVSSLKATPARASTWPCCPLTGGVAHPCLLCLLGPAGKMTSWSRGVTASTLDPESSDCGSNPRETCRARGMAVPACKVCCGLGLHTLPVSCAGALRRVPQSLVSTAGCRRNRPAGLVV